MTKRILAMVMAIAMVLCSMGTVVFAAEIDAAYVADSESDRGCIKIEYVGGNYPTVTESMEVEYYSGDEKIATTSLKSDYTLPGEIGTVNTVFWGKESGSWETKWEGVPNALVMPTSAKVSVDGGEFTEINEIGYLDGNVHTLTKELWSSTKGVYDMAIDSMDLYEKDGVSAIQTNLSEIYAEESLVVEIYSGETKIATTKATDINFPVNTYTAEDKPGEHYYTCASYITGSDGYWKTEWHVGPSSAYAPTKSVLYVDGKEADTFIVADVPANSDNFDTEVWLNTDGVTPVATVDGEKYATLADAVKAIKDNSEVIINAGEYEGKLEITEKNVTVKANGDVKITGGTPVFKGTNWYVEGIDFEYDESYNNINTSGTLKECNFTSKGHTFYYCYGSTDGKLVIDGCTFTVGGLTKRALHFDDAANSEIIIKDSKFDGIFAMPGTLKSLTAENTTFKGYYANTWGGTITYDKCHFDVNYTYTGDEDTVVNFNNCTTEDGESIEELLYDDDALVFVDNKCVTRDAKIGDEYYKTLDDAKAAAQPGDLIELTNGTFYKTPETAGTDQVVITFDFDGGTNAAKYMNSTAVYNLRDSVTAPTGIKKEGYIFAGWANENGERVDVDPIAYGHKTYYAQWLAEADYGFEAVLTPVGGENVDGKANEIKINPESSFIVEVSIADAVENMAWNVTEVTVTYDSKLFTWNDIDGTVTEKINKDGINELTFKVYGEDKVSGKVAKQLSFTTKENTNKTSTFEGVFAVDKATVDAGWVANIKNATDAETSTAKVYIYYTFDVTLGDGIEKFDENGEVVTPSTADTITDYEGKIKDYDPNYNYDIIIDMDGNDDLDVDYNEDGTFTIPNEEIAGDFSIDAVVTGIKGISVDDVEVHEYVEGKYALVLVNAAKKFNGKYRYYTYNGANMFVASHYDKYSGLKQTYAYLIKDGGFVAEQDPTDAKKTTLNTPANKALALSKIKLGTEANLKITGIDSIGDVNYATTGKTVIDVNDIQAAWNAYNASSNDAPKVNENIDFYFRADVNRDKKVDMKDCNIVVEMYEKGVKGKKATLATCEKDGLTFSIPGLIEEEVISALGHDYDAQTTGEGANAVVTRTCTQCGAKETAKLSTAFAAATDNGNGTYSGTFDVDNGAELVLLNNLIDEGVVIANEAKVMTVNINADINLAGNPWKSMNGYFTTINGNNHTISNIVTGQGAIGRGGFVGYGGACHIYDLTIENITTNGTQVGAFMGAGEGSTLSNCFLKGDVNITWAQNTTSDYVEKTGSIGIIVGNHYGKGTYQVTIDKDANIVVDDSEFSTAIEDYGYTTKYAPYIQYVNEKSASPVVDITDNRN